MNSLFAHWITSFFIIKKVKESSPHSIECATNSRNGLLLCESFCNCDRPNFSRRQQTIISVCFLLLQFFLLFALNNRKLLLGRNSKRRWGIMMNFHRDLTKDQKPKIIQVHFLISKKISRNFSRNPFLLFYSREKTTCTPDGIEWDIFLRGQMKIIDRRNYFWDTQ